LFGQTDSITPYPSPGVLDGVYTPEYKHGKSIIYHKPSTMAVWERTDTNFFENGRIESITELNAFGQRIGVNKEFDSTGVLRIEGEYTQMDSSKCLNCYEGYFGDDTLGSWHKIDKINVREVKVGISLEEALIHLNKRMPSEELDLIVSAILVGRETGGDLTKVFSRLVTTIRDRAALKENVKTLTLQGRLQGIIMSLIPIVFAVIVYKMNPHHFDIMFSDDLGRILLGVAVVLQIVGVILLKIFSKVDI